MPASKLTYKRCCICGKKFPVIMGGVFAPLDLVNFQPCKCDSCKKKQKKL